MFILQKLSIFLVQAKSFLDLKVLALSAVFHAFCAVFVNHIDLFKAQVNELIRNDIILTRVFFLKKIYQITFFLKQHKLEILWICFVYLGLYILFHAIIRIRYYLKYRKQLLKKSITQNSLFSVTASFKSFSAFLKKYYSVKIASLLLSLEENLKDIPAFKNPFLFYRFVRPVFLPVKKVSDLFGDFIEKLLVSFKVAKPIHKGEDILISRVSESESDNISLEIPEDLKQEFKEQNFEQGQEYINFFPEQKKVVTKVLERFEKKLSASFLISGKDGSGKSVLIESILKAYLRNKEVLRFKIPLTPFRKKGFESFLKQVCGSSHLEEAVEFLNSKKSCVIIADDFENLCFNAPGGYQPALDFLNLMEKTEDHHLWIVSINEYSYRFFNQIVPISQTFEFQLNMNALSGEDIQRLFRRKAYLKGFTLYPDISKQKLGFLKKKIKKQELKYSEVPNYLLNQYFSTLTMYCENIFPALYFYFLRSVSFIRDKKIYLKDPEIIKLDFLNEMKASYCFILTAVFVHQNLSLDELESLSGFLKDEISLFLAILEEKEMILSSKTQEVTYYRINPVVQIQLIQYLKKSNFLYF